MHDIVVISDLHIGRGRNPSTARYHTLETFFYDDDLRGFCRFLCEEARTRGVGLKLVFNGDTFDFIRLDPDREHAASRREQRFGSDMSPVMAGRVAAEILAGHPVFVEALADVLQAGHELVFLPGNHDIEIAWSTVHDEMRRAIEHALVARGVPDPAAALAHLKFAPWFVHEPGRVWIEHGCQYDPECAFRYPLRGALAKGPGEDDGGVLELDMPLGNFFQRYLYNAFGPITFIVPSTRANSRYMRWLLLHEPRLLFRVVASHLPFILQVLRRLAKRAGGAEKPLREAHETALEDLASSSGLGDTLRRIDAMKNVSGDVLQAAREYGKEGLRFAAVGLGVGVASEGIWSTGFMAISELGTGVGLKALLLLALNFLLLSTVAAGIAYTFFRSSPSAAPFPLRRGAQALVEALDVPVVVFGHTHDEVIWRLDRPGGKTGWYYNSGTWIAVFTHDVLLPRERVQFTFFRLRGTQPELLHWSPGRREALPVILLDEVAPDVALAPAAAAQPAA